MPKSTQVSEQRRYTEGFLSRQRKLQGRKPVREMCLLCLRLRKTATVADVQQVSGKVVRDKDRIMGARLY